MAILSKDLQISTPLKLFEWNTLSEYLKDLFEKRFHIFQIENYVLASAGLNLPRITPVGNKKGDGNVPFLIFQWRRGESNPGPAENLETLRRPWRSRWNRRQE